VSQQTPYRVYTRYAEDVEHVEACRADVGSMFLETGVDQDDNSEQSNMLTE